MSLRRYLNLALKEASKSKCNQRLGCVAISSNRVVSKGFNRHLSEAQDTRRKGEHAIHAEAIALRRTGGNLVDCLVVARLTQGGIVSMALPCKRCLDHCRRSGVKYVFYTDWSGQIQKVKV